MAWWVLTQSAPLATFNTLTLRAFTNYADHLFVSWNYYKPARHPIYKIIRGKRVQCGYKYIWDTPFITEQIQTGDTLYHRFELTDLRLRSTIWYYLWAPEGPYGSQIQGPLQHITLRPPPFWPPIVCVGTRLKGVFFTRNFTGPEGYQPYWIPVNGGLHSLKIWQLCPDLLAPAARIFAIAGDAGSRVVYRLEPPHCPWWHPFLPDYFPDWQPMLTNAQACALTGSTGGQISWIAANINLPGRFYVLFNSSLTDNGTWCIRSQDYGATWTPFQIYAGIQNYRAGNIMAGLGRGASPYAHGTVLYAALNCMVGARTAIFLSTDRGETWTLRDFKGMGALTPRCYVEPADYSTVYVGAYTDAANPHELWRSEEHGANLAQVDGAHHLGSMILPYQGQMWLEDADIHFARVLIGNHVWTTTNYCATWTHPGATPVDVSRLSIISHSPNYLYLARRTNCPPFGQPGYPHVIFISTNEGLILWGKAGDHADLPDGGRDSIPGDCGGVAHDGILHPEPNAWTLWG